MVVFKPIFLLFNFTWLFTTYAFMQIYLIKNLNIFVTSDGSAAHGRPGAGDGQDGGREQAQLPQPAAGHVQHVPPLRPAAAVPAFPRTARHPRATRNDARTAETDAARDRDDDARISGTGGAGARTTVLSGRAAGR